MTLHITINLKQIYSVLHARKLSRELILVYIWMNSKFKGDFNVSCIAMLFKCLFWIKFLPILTIFSFILHAICAQNVINFNLPKFTQWYLLGRWDKTIKFKIKNSLWRTHFNGGHFSKHNELLFPKFGFFFLTVPITANLLHFPLNSPTCTWILSIPQQNTWFYGVDSWINSASETLLKFHKITYISYVFVPLLLPLTKAWYFFFCIPSEKVILSS